MKPPHLCKNNPKLRLQRGLGLFLHTWDRCGFFNTPFLKSLGSHKVKQKLNHPVGSISLSTNRYIFRKIKESYLFIIIDGATLMTLEYIFSAIRTDSRIGWHWGWAPRTLKRFRGRLNVLVKICIFNHQITGHDRKWEFNFDLSLSRGQGNFSSLVPHSWPIF